MFLEDRPPIPTPRDKLFLWNTYAPETAIFWKKDMTFLFDLDFGRWPWPWYQQMCIDKMYLHTKCELCNLKKV